jgi:hypothetical protein
MTGKNEVSKALDGAFRAAFMLTGSMQAAEHAVLSGIAATECYTAGDDAFLFEIIEAAIQRRPDSLHQSQQPPAHLPLELRRLFLLTPISRDCFVLRILLGIAVGTFPGFCIAGSRRLRTCFVPPFKSCHASKLAAEVA